MPWFGAARDTQPPLSVSSPPFDTSGDGSKASADHDKSFDTPEPRAVIVDHNGKTWMDEMSAGNCDGQERDCLSRPSEVVSDLNCPITKYIMTDPVRAEDGITYQRNNIEAWFKEHGAVSPMVKEMDGSRKRIGTSLVPDDSRRSAIQSLSSSPRSEPGPSRAAGSSKEAGDEDEPTWLTDAEAAVKVSWDPWGQQSHQRSVTKCLKPLPVAEPRFVTVVHNVTQEVSMLFKIFDPLKWQALDVLGGLAPPKIVVIGEQSHGKSTLLEMIIKMPIFPRRMRFCTRMAIHVRLRRPSAEGEAPSVTMSVRNDKDGSVEGSTERIPIASGYQFVQDKMDELAKSADEGKPADERSGIVVDKFLQLDIVHPDVPVLDLVDLPGMVVVDDPQYPGKRDAIRKIYEQQIARDKAEEVTSIYLTVVASPDSTHQPVLNSAVQFVVENRLQDRAIGVFTKADCSPPKELHAYVTNEPLKEYDDDGTEAGEITASEMGGVSLKTGGKHSWLATMLKMPDNAPYYAMHGIERITKMANDERGFFGDFASWDPARHQHDPGIAAMLRDLYDRGLAGQGAVGYQLQAKYLDHVRIAWMPVALGRLSQHELWLYTQRTLLGCTDATAALHRTREILYGVGKLCHEHVYAQLLLTELQASLSGFFYRWVGRGDSKWKKIEVRDATGPVTHPAAAALEASFDNVADRLQSVVSGQHLTPCQVMKLDGFLAKKALELEALVYDAVGQIRTKYTTELVRHLNAKVEVTVSAENRLQAVARQTYDKNKYWETKDSRLVRALFDTERTLPDSNSKELHQLVVEQEHSVVQLGSFPGHTDAVSAAVGRLCDEAVVKIKAATDKLIMDLVSPSSQYLESEPCYDALNGVMFKWRSGSEKLFVDKLLVAIARYLPTPEQMEAVVDGAGDGSAVIRLDAFEEDASIVARRRELDGMIARVQKATLELVELLWSSLIHKEDVDEGKPLAAELERVRREHSLPQLRPDGTVVARDHSGFDGGTPERMPGVRSPTSSDGSPGGGIRSWATRCAASLGSSSSDDLQMPSLELAAADRYATMSVKELKAEAKRRGIDLSSRAALEKSELIALLQPGV